MQNNIEIFEAKEHNLKSISLKIPRDRLVVITGVSGSGKSSLAYDTIYQEGQRRFIQSLSPYARQFLGQNTKADVEKITGLSPTICIDQKTVNRNPRSTVGTITEISTNLRLLMARLGTPHCPECQAPLVHQGLQIITETLLKKYKGKKISILAPIVVSRKGEYRKEIAQAQKDGFVRVRIDGKIYRSEEAIELQLSRYEKHDIDLIVDRLSIPENIEDCSDEKRQKSMSRMLSSLELAIGYTENVFAVLCSTKDKKTSSSIPEYKLYSTELTCVEHGYSAPEMEPRLFSFNAPQGMCLDCNGIGYHEDFLWEQMINENAIVKHAFLPLAEFGKIPFTLLTQELWENIISKMGLSGDEVWSSLSNSKKRELCLGADISFTSYKETPRGTRVREHLWRGCFEAMQYSWEIARPKKLRKYRQQVTCSSCNGARLNPLALNVLFRGNNIDEFQHMSIDNARDYFESIELHHQEAKIGIPILKELVAKLKFLSQVGLGYLDLSRTSKTLSGGESQRIRLAAQVGSGLQGITYILDEPSIGLHPTDQGKLLDALEKLRDNGNSVLVIEHDPITMHRADHLIEIGPQAGISGGRVIKSGSYKQFMKSKALTAQYMRNEKRIEIPERRDCKDKDLPTLSIYKASSNNLKNIDFHLPLGRFVVVTGVSGSAKSTLITQTLSKAIKKEIFGYLGETGQYDRIVGLSHIDKLVEIDQSPIGRTPRSNPATYTGLLDPIRDLLSQTLESRRRGYTKSRFSFNVDPQKGGGRCEGCDGGGYNVVEMQFLPNVHVTCDICSGKRFTQETLNIRFNGKNIHEILEMKVEEAKEFFKNHKKIHRILQTLSDVGLGYISLGQPSTTLSGGEAQRIKLASELQRVSTGKTLYILDEPTTGLHMDDVNRLLKILQKLVSLGNSVVVIEHDIDVIKSADHIIDLGPEGGENGGYITHVGTPEEISNFPTPTGRILREVLCDKHAVEFDSLLQKRSSRKPSGSKKIKDVHIRGATLHNLKNIDVRFPSGQITTITGLSGSGKTTLAFDTLFSEGQRRYIESLSTYARRFLGRLKKPPVDKIDGLAPAICIDQSNRGKTPRSTVATSTEIHDYLRIIYANLGTIHCPECNTKIVAHPPATVMEKLKDNEKRGWLLTKLEGEIVAGELTQNGYGKILEEEEVQTETLQKKNFIYKEKRLVEIKEVLESPLVIIDRFAPAKITQRRLIQGVDQAYNLGNDRCMFIEKDTGHKYEFAREATCFDHGKPFVEMPTPRHFSFNTKIGACQECNGLGTSQNISWTALFPEPQKAFWEAIHGWVKVSLSRSRRFAHILNAVFKEHRVPIKSAVVDYPVEFKNILLYGDKKEYVIAFQVRRSSFEEKMKWEGIEGMINKWNNDAEWLRESGPCRACNGTRLQKPQLSVYINGENIAQNTTRSIESSLDFWKGLQLSKSQMQILEHPREELIRRLQFLKDVGLGYLTLDRPTKTLSGGESQRIRLASQLGSGLTRSIYVLDEPTIGLHSSDTKKLIDTLHDIRSKGNTLVIVEHDEEVIRNSDYLVDIGPGAGKYGGKIVAKGKIENIENEDSLTVDYLCKRKEIPTPTEYRERNKSDVLSIKKAHTNNLKDIDVEFPIGSFCVVCGVSGSGKSSLVFGDVEQYLITQIARRESDRKKKKSTMKLKVKRKKDKKNEDGKPFPQKYLCVDQSPIGRSPRSTPASYCDIMNAIREVFAQTKLSRQRGYKIGRFSFNANAGRCEYCEGKGSTLIEMHFLSDVWLECESCQGARFNQATLEVKFNGKNIAEVLEMSVDESIIFFANQPKILRKLKALHELGLGYIQLGQPANQFSGGEAQRIKLAKELAKGSRSRNCCFLLDEPTTGLHFDDVNKLIRAFHRLVDSGHTIIVIEHNLDIIKNADFVVELGPTGGTEGGKVVFVGNPKELQRTPTQTGKILKKHLE